MALSDEHVVLLAKIREEWNSTEDVVKIAEQVCNNIVIPSIKELRYAGRRIVDVLYYMHMPDPESAEKLQALLHDAHFDCHRARHDAIDAATAKIAADVETMINRLGYDAILPVFPRFPQVVAQLESVRTKIASSRLQRERREAIYAAMESEDFKLLIQAYREMRGSEPIGEGVALLEIGVGMHPA